MTETERDTYPHELAGAPARPPVAVRASVMAMAADARRHQLVAELDQPPRYGFVMPDWRPAASLVVLREELDHAHPGRDTSSDGMVGNAAHAGGGPGSPEWDDSDHNPWLIVGRLGVVRALDITNDPDVDLPALFERLRADAHAGKLPQLLGGGYLILNGRITTPSFDGWRTYKGENPHVLHGHASVSRSADRFDDRGPWGIARGHVPAKPVEPPKPSKPTGWPGPDLRGSGLLLRGAHGASGARVKALQDFMRRTYPLYSKAIDVDGWWGSETSGVLREFARRTGIRSATGRDLGPQLARKLYVAGFRG